MAAIIVGNGYRVTVEKFDIAYRAQWVKDNETVGSFRWCDDAAGIAELLEELELCD